MSDREPDPAHAMSRGDAWDDLQLERLDSGPRFDRWSDGVLIYAPVYKKEILLGYLWASEDGTAANFLNRDSVGAEGRNAKGAWVRRLLESKGRGLTSVQALEAWVGSTEDERAGHIPKGVSLERISGLSELRRLTDS
ncbi:hypothetical protein KIK06_09425 [Nocardiopsis sp. EMB25]|uniref:hypothetical protein n=1 Tax=Nocardiopsis sp. EMB25 TaxID=2835867 RepID=UPI002284830C|nr:hypothetical protein [Nocardiopsis sp. EMB25]MCY9784112.1 hypothetical protein [Nocardiopsis sp. EMB25]